MEEYGTRLCVRIDGVPTVDNNTSDEVLDKVKFVIEQISYDISDGVSNRFHRTGKRYNKKEKTNAPCENVIMRITTFRYRTMSYRR